MEAAIYRDRKQHVEGTSTQRTRGNTLAAALLIRSSADSSMSLCHDLPTLSLPTA
jgi:hypothetical protein